MFNKLKLTDNEMEKTATFMKWCFRNEKDIVKMALNKDYMQEVVNEYEGEMKNEN